MKPLKSQMFVNKSPSLIYISQYIQILRDSKVEIDFFTWHDPDTKLSFHFDEKIAIILMTLMVTIKTTMMIMMLFLLLDIVAIQPLIFLNTTGFQVWYCLLLLVNYFLDQNQMANY